MPLTINILMPKYLLLTFFYCFNFFALAQEKTSLNFYTIPSELKKNANAIVRLQQTIIEIPNLKKLNYYNKRIITVLNKEGDKKVKAFVGYDNQIKISKLQATIYDAMGKEINKFNKSKFKDVSAINDFSLYEDSRVKYLNYTPTNYPYTIVFEYAYSTKNTAYIPTWEPLEGYYTSTENNEFKVLYNSDSGINTLEKNFEKFKITNNSKEGEIYYKANNLKAIKYETLSPPFRNFTPHALISPIHFNYEGYLGDTSSWQSLGKWMNEKILKDRNSLSLETQSKIKELVKTVDNPIEKAKIIYNYVQENTRYISVQIGIGGIQPIEAKEVDKVKYGDCKGLTNYTKALLNVVGVPSNYALVYASADNEKSILKDFVSLLGQANHVILNIPTQNEDIWLECTSQDTPFNYIGNFTGNRDALVVTPEGGKIVPTKTYTKLDNVRNTKAKVTIKKEGNIDASITIISNGTRYYNRSLLEKRLEKDNRLFYKKEWSSIPNLKIHSISYTNKKEDITFTETLKATASNYASTINNGLLFSPNLFYKPIENIPRYSTRRLPFQIKRGTTTINTVEITIPKTMQVEALQKNSSVSKPFGSYEYRIHQKNDNTIELYRKLELNKGTYKPEEYASFRNFLLEISKQDNARIIIKNKT